MKNSMKFLSITVLSLLLGDQCFAMKGMTDKTQGNRLYLLMELSVNPRIRKMNLRTPSYLQRLFFIISPQFIRCLYMRSTEYRSHSALNDLTPISSGSETTSLSHPV